MTWCNYRSGPSPDCSFIARSPASAGRPRADLLATTFALPVEEEGDVVTLADGTKVHDQKIAAPGEARRHVDGIEGDVNFATIGRHEIGIRRAQWKGRGYKNSAGEEKSHARIQFLKSLGRLD